jgi:transcriptional regulator with XRE-family HTH domain
VEKFQLGAYLRNVRTSQKLSTRDLEKRARESDESKLVTAGQISKIENEKTDPGFKTVQKIAELLDIPLVIILDGGQENIDKVTIVSSDEIAQGLPVALKRQELVQLLVLCIDLTDEEIDAILGVARVMRKSAKPANADE